MADTKISALTDATALTDTDYLVIVDDTGGTPTSKRLDAADAKTYFQTGAHLAGGTDVPVADGGTGASDAATARTNLGLAIGTDVASTAAASATASGIVELATIAEVDTGTDTARAITPAGLAGSALASAVTTNTAKVTNATHTGDVTGATALTIASGAVSLSKMANMATASLLGRNTAGTGAPEVLSASTVRTLLGLVIGTNVQAYDAELAAIAGLTSAADRLPYFTGSGTASLATFTAAGRALIDDADAAAQRTTLSAAQDYVGGVNYTGTTDTLASTDHGALLHYSNASAVTVTLPTNASVALSTGFWCLIMSTGAGGVTLTTTSLTLLGSSPKKTIAQNQAMLVLKTGTDTWAIIGGTAT